jgi:hypothetical protein
MFLLVIYIRLQVYEDLYAISSATSKRISTLKVRLDKLSNEVPSYCQRLVNTPCKDLLLNQRTPFYIEVKEGRGAK